MAKKKSSSSDVITGAAGIVGSALGTIAGTVDHLRADHPHPVKEAKDALAAGQQQIAEIAADARKRAAVVIKTTKAAITKLRKQSAKARKRAAQPRRGSRKTVKPAKRAAAKPTKRGKK